MDGLALEQVSHSFGRVRALADVDLTVRSGEIVCLVGPSGCGKSTLLRLAAGLEPLQRGRVAIDGRTMAEPGRSVPPEARRIGLVFQDYALFPHLSVIENVTFGLEGSGAAARRERALDVLRQVGMAESAGAYPHTLSGGQQQRVALARALAPSPQLMLFDEPFSGLDTRLRDQVRDQTLHVLKQRGATTLLVTHDPEEAMFMGDRIAVMRAGRIEQVGRPVDVYFHPASPFVANFFSELNRLRSAVAAGKVATPFGSLKAAGLEEGAAVDVLIRPEALRLGYAPEGENGGADGADAGGARVVTSHMLGRSTLIHLDAGEFRGQKLHFHSRIPGNLAFGEGDRVKITLDPSQAFVFLAGGDK